MSGLLRFNEDSSNELGAVGDMHDMIEFELVNLSLFDLRRRKRESIARQRLLLLDGQMEEPRIARLCDLGSEFLRRSGRHKEQPDLARCRGAVLDRQSV